MPEIVPGREHRPAEGAAQRNRAGGWLIVTLLLGLAAPFALLEILYRRGHDVSGTVLAVALAAVVVTLLLTLLDGLALGTIGRAPRAPLSDYPEAGVLLLVERETPPADLVAAVERFLRPHYLYPHPLTVLVRGASDEQWALLDQIRDRERVVRLDHPEAEVSPAIRLIGSFTPDQIPRSGAFARAWLWLSRGNRILYTHRILRGYTRFSRWVVMAAEGPGPESWLLDAYLPEVARTGTLFTFTPRPGSSVPAGRATDPDLLIEQPAPSGVRSWWAAQLAREQALLTVPVRAMFTRRRASRFPVMHATCWRPAYVWLALLVPAAVIFRLWHHHTSSAGLPLTAAALYLAGEPWLRVLVPWGRPRAEPRRTWSYFLVGSPLLVGLEHSAARVAQLQAIFGRRRAVTRAGVIDLPAEAEPDVQPARGTVAALPVSAESAEELAPEGIGHAALLPVAGGTAAEEAPPAAVEIEPPAPDEEETAAMPPLPAALSMPAESVAADGVHLNGNGPGGRTLASEAELPPALPRELEGGAVEETLPDLEHGLEDLLAALERDDQERRRLAERVTALDAAITEELERVQRLQRVARDAVDTTDIEAVNAVLRRLTEDDQNILTLAELGQQAPALAHIIDAYTAARSALGESEPAPAENSRERVIQ